MSNPDIPREEILALGFNEDSHKRLTFRLLWLIQEFRKRQGVLMAGNLASLEPELAALNANAEDLSNVLYELVTLLNTTLNRTEQGLISPPNESANSSGSPEGP